MMGNVPGQGDEDFHLGEEFVPQGRTEDETESETMKPRSKVFVFEK